VRKTVLLNLGCITATLSLFADEGSVETVLMDEIHQDLVSKAEPAKKQAAPEKKSGGKQVVIPQHEVEAWAGEETDIVLQVQPGSRVIVRSAEAAEPVSAAKPILAQQSTDPAAPMAVQNGNHPIGVTVSGSYLWWIAEEDGLEYVLTGAEDFFGLPPYKQGKTYRPDFKWDSGVRVGALYEHKDMWDIGLAWTRFATSAHRELFHELANINTSSSMSFWAMWSASEGLVAATNTANARWNLSYWTIELMTGIPCRVREHISLRPSVGVIQAGIKQRYNILYDVTAGFSHMIKMKNYFSGTGLRAACDAIWDINRYFGFFTRVGFSVLAGHFHVSEEQETTRPFNFSPLVPNDTGRFLDVRNTPHTMKTEVDFNAGFHVEYPIFSGRSNLKLDCGWDFLLWFDQNQFMRFVGEGSQVHPAVTSYKGRYMVQHGDLFLQGLNVTAGWEF